jgi:hypothetical protein
VRLLSRLRGGDEASEIGLAANLWPTHSLSQSRLLYSPASLYLMFALINAEKAEMPSGHPSPSLEFDEINPVSPRWL